MRVMAAISAHRTSGYRSFRSRRFGCATNLVSWNYLQQRFEAWLPDHDVAGNWQLSFLLAESGARPGRNECTPVELNDKAVARK